MNKQELIERLKDFKVPFGDESEESHNPAEGSFKTAIFFRVYG